MAGKVKMTKLFKCMRPLFCYLSRVIKPFAIRTEIIVPQKSSYFQVFLIDFKEMFEVSKKEDILIQVKLLFSTVFRQVSTVGHMLGIDSAFYFRVSFNKEGPLLRNDILKISL